MSTDTPCSTWTEPKNFSTLLTSTEAIPAFLGAQPLGAPGAARGAGAGPA
jgi:hypothetical protein